MEFIENSCLKWLNKDDINSTKFHRVLRICSIFYLQKHKTYHQPTSSSCNFLQFPRARIPFGVKEYDFQKSTDTKFGQFAPKAIATSSIEDMILQDPTTK